MKAFIVPFCAIVSLVIGLELAHGAEFTVDKRSAYHAGASGAIGFTGAYIMKRGQQHNGFSDWTIVGISTTGSQVPGLFKEFVSDAYPDYGDLTFNLVSGLVGSWAGVWTGHWVNIRKQGDAALISYTMEF